MRKTNWSDAFSQPLIVVGGHQREMDKSRHEWSLYDRGIIARIDPVTGAAKVLVNYQSPANVTPDVEEPLSLFKAGTLIGDFFYTCTSTEIIVYRTHDYSIINYITHPYFNDLHHVLPIGDGLLAVVNTGLDMVIVIAECGRVEAEYSVNDYPLWVNFSKDIDYRKVPSTKPHHSHPNFIFGLDGELWVTRCNNRDALCLNDRSRSFDIGFQYVHDGIVHDGCVYFTTVDSHIVIFDAKTYQKLDVINLNAINKKNRPLGWCRGLSVLGKGLIVVGFTRLRKTKYNEKLDWLKYQVGVGGQITPEPAHIAAFDLNKRELIWHIETEANVEMHAIFGIYPDNSLSSNGVNI